MSFREVNSLTRGHCWFESLASPTSEHTRSTTVLHVLKPPSVIATVPTRISCFNCEPENDHSHLVKVRPMPSSTEMTSMSSLSFTPMHPLTSTLVLSARDGLGTRRHHKVFLYSGRTTSSSRSYCLLVNQIFIKCLSGAMGGRDEV